MCTYHHQVNVEYTHYTKENNYVQFNTNNSDRAVQVQYTLPLQPDDEIIVQAMRGSEGVNDGYLKTDIPANTDWLPVPSARIAISQNVVA